MKCDSIVPTPWPTSTMSRCVETLEQLAITQPAFRAMTLNGLTILDHFEAQEA
jgi:hypothetical protein